MAATRRTPRRPRWWWELLTIACLLWVYDFISNLAPLRRTAALNNATGVWHAERFLHLDPEGTLNHWLAAHFTLGLWASDYYNNAHFIVTLGVIGWLWWYHHDVFRPLRTTLVLVNVLAFVVFWLAPMAPPRLLPGGHITDVVALTHGFGSWHSGTLATVSDANQLASMPSLHLGWAIWCAWAIWRVFPRRPVAWVAMIHPLLTAYVVMATGNHYFFDVVAGGLTLVAAQLITDRLPSLTTVRARLALRRPLAAEVTAEVTAVPVAEEAAAEGPGT